MRTTLVPAFISILLGACLAGEISGPGGGDDEGGGAACGDSVVDSGEACDDGNTLDGDGCSASCSTEIPLVPRVAAMLDKTDVSTELGKNELVTLDLQSVDGFAGSVSVVASVVDAANAPIEGITVSGPTTLGLAADGTANGMYAIEVATDATGLDLTATLKLELTSEVGTETLTSNVAVAAIYTFTLAAGTGANNDMHPGTGKEVTIRRGVKLRMTNSDTVEHITHGGGIPHEPTQEGANGQPGATYEVDTTPIAPGTGKSFGCHTHGSATYATVNLI